MPPIYLDYNATTPLLPEVVDAMLPYLREVFGNPSSSHAYGRAARRAVDTAREQVAGLLGCRPDEIVFTSGGTESNNLAIRGAALAGRGRGNHIVTSAVEHPAVTEVCRDLEAAGFRVTYVPVDAAGRVRPADIEAALTAETVLVTVMHANNEVGTLQPIEDIARLASRRGILFHTDAAQSVGKIPVGDLGVDLLSLAGHKAYAPKGVGALFVRRGTALSRVLAGAGQEQGRRPGTENVASIVGLGMACASAARDLEELGRHLCSMRDRLEGGLLSAVPGIRRNGSLEHRLPNTTSLAFSGIEAHALLTETPEVAASPGAACHSGRTSTSPVLAAMGVPEELARGTVRFSTGRMTGAKDIDAAVLALARSVERLRAS